MIESYRTVNEWLEARPLLWFVFAAVLPALTYIGAGIASNGESFASVAPLGIVFGLTFAVVTVVGNRLLSH